MSHPPSPGIGRPPPPWPPPTTPPPTPPPGAVGVGLGGRRGRSSRSAGSNVPAIIRSMRPGSSSGGTVRRAAELLGGQEQQRLQLLGRQVLDGRHQLRRQPLEGGELRRVDEGEQRVQAVGQQLLQVGGLRQRGRFPSLGCGRRRGRLLAADERVPERRLRVGAARGDQPGGRRIARAAQLGDEPAADARQPVADAGLVQVLGRPLLGLVVEQQGVVLGVVGALGGGEQPGGVRQRLLEAADVALERAADRGELADVALERRLVGLQQAADLDRGPVEVGDEAR